MSLFKLDQAPKNWNPGHGDPVATEAGWVDPITGEILCAIGKLIEKRRNYLDAGSDNILLEDGSLFLLEQDLDSDHAPDYLTLG